MRSFQKLTMLLAITAASSLLFATGCGGCDDDDDVDARPPAPDAGVDAEVPDAEPPDAAPTSTHTGQITVADVKIVTDKAPYYGAEYGHGLKQFISFYPYIDPATNPNIVYDDRDWDSGGEGCVAYVYDLSDEEHSPQVKEDHGDVTVTGTTNPFPASGCVWLEAITNYICPSANGTADNVTIASYGGTLGTFTFTDTDASFVATDAGKYLNITALNGMDDYPWNGAFPIIAVVNATTVVIANSAPAAQTLELDPDQLPGVYGPGIGISSNPLNTSSPWMVLAGAGPIPPGPAGSPEGIADDDKVVISLADDPTGDFEDFTTQEITVGTDFSPDPATRALLMAPKVDGTAFSMKCDDDVASNSGTGPSFEAGAGDNMVLRDTGAFPATLRLGAKLTISNATTSDNNGDYIITAADADTVTYVNANGVAEAFGDSTAYVVNDCGSAFLTGVSFDFNDGPAQEILAQAAGAGPNFVFDSTNHLLTISDTTNHPFSPAYFGRYLAVAGATTSDNDGNYYPIIAATNDTITVPAATGNTEAFAAGTSYTVFKLLGVGDLPDESTATKVGYISCAKLGGTQIDIPAGAAAAFATVDPTMVMSTFVRSGIAFEGNEDGTNKTNVLVGHGYASYIPLE